MHPPRTRVQPPRVSRRSVRFVESASEAPAASGRVARGPAVAATSAIEPALARRAAGLSAGGSRAVATSATEPTAFDRYLRDLDGLGLLSPAQELAAAEAIAAARTELWMELLAYPPFTAAVVDRLAVAQQQLDLPEDADAEDATQGRRAVDPRLAVVLDEARVSARKVRDRTTRAHREAFAAAVAAAAPLAAAHDRDGETAASVLADLERIAAQRAAVALQVTAPPRGSAPFQRYVAACRAAAARLQRARERFVHANLRLVIAMARRFRHSGMSLQDLVQEGNLGLLKAVDRFDPARGFRFSTYASWWIRHAINRGLADRGREVRLPVHMVALQQRVARMCAEAERVHGRAPSATELARELGLPVRRVELALEAMQRAMISLDAPLHGDEARSAIDLLVDPSAPNPDLDIDRARHEFALEQLLRELRPIEADIVRRRFGLDERPAMTLQEIGEVYGLSRERIRQLELQALERLRAEFGRRGLVERRASA